MYKLEIFIPAMTEDQNTDIDYDTVNTLVNALRTRFQAPVARSFIDVAAANFTDTVMRIEVYAANVSPNDVSWLDTAMTQFRSAIGNHRAVKAVYYELANAGGA